MLQTLPDCELTAVYQLRRLDGRHLYTLFIRVGDQEADIPFVLDTLTHPPKYEIIERLQMDCHRATQFLRDFVADWPNQSYRGRQKAIREWKRLRRQRVTLKRLFGDSFP